MQHKSGRKAQVNEKKCVYLRVGAKIFLLLLWAIVIIRFKVKEKHKKL